MTDAPKPPEEESVPDDNAAWHPGENEERTEAQREEINSIASSVAVLEDFFADLDADIDSMRGVDIIDGVNPGSEEKHVLMAILSIKDSRARLIKMRKKYQVKYASHIKVKDIDE